MKKIVAIIFLLSVFYLYAETSVWKISKGDAITYLGGTVHILRESDYPLPEAFNEAFEQSSTIVFEITDSNDILDEASDMNARLESYLQHNEVKKFYRLTESLTILSMKYPELMHKIEKRDTANLSDDEKTIFSKIVTISSEIQIHLSIPIVQEFFQFLTETFNSTLLQTIMNPNLTPLREILDDGTYEQLRVLCNMYDVSITDIQYLKPFMAITRLTGEAWKNLGYTDNGVDSYFMKLARQQNKNIEALETFQFQYELLANLGSEYGSSYYAYLLQDFGTEEDHIAGMSKTVLDWRNGTADNESLTGLEYEMEHFPIVYETMLKNRNDAWMPKIEGYLETPETEFILVGNGHMHGPDGLLTLLESKGYEIEQQ